MEAWPASRWVLLESMAKRIELLEWAVDELGIAERVTVVGLRAEHVSRVGERLRASCTIVTSRGFGAPPLTAEAAAPLLVPGGHLIVSEPPDSTGERWPETGVAQLGLAPIGVVRTDRAGYMVLEQRRPAPPEFPRSWKRQARHPLFGGSP